MHVLHVCEQTALMQACQHGHWEVVQILVVFGANVRLLFLVIFLSFSTLSSLEG